MTLIPQIYLCNDYLREKIMGHSNYATTMNLYVYTKLESLRGAINIKAFDYPPTLAQDQ